MRLASLDGAVPSYCSRCRTRLRVWSDTDRDGGLIELVDPCPTCARATAMRPKRSSDRPHRVHQCDVCDGPIVQAGPGRPRKRHPWCKTKASRPPAPLVVR